MQSFKTTFNTLFEAYPIDWGLGETTLLESQCFCTDLTGVSNSSIQRVIDHQKHGIWGYCQKKYLCKKCHPDFASLCNVQLRR